MVIPPSKRVLRVVSPPETGAPTMLEKTMSGASTKQESADSTWQGKTGAPTMQENADGVDSPR